MPALRTLRRNRSRSHRESPPSVRASRPSKSTRIRMPVSASADECSDDDDGLLLTPPRRSPQIKQESPPLEAIDQIEGASIKSEPLPFELAYPYNVALVILRIRVKDHITGSHPDDFDPDGTFIHIKTFLRDAPQLKKLCRKSPFYWSFLLPSEDGTSKTKDRIETRQKALVKHLDGCDKVAVILSCRTDTDDGGVIYNDEAQAELSQVIDYILTEEIISTIKSASETLLILDTGGSYMMYPDASKAFEAYADRRTFQHIVGFSQKNFERHRVWPYLADLLTTFLSSESDIHTYLNTTLLHACHSVVHETGIVYTGEGDELGNLRGNEGDNVLDLGITQGGLVRGFYHVNGLDAEEFPLGFRHRVV